ncbi:non-ribosomal peptide synthetase [Corallococcus sp. AS-1-6]|uniref:amino acid adenylation domain-containing protein n=1 Tax=Corallococcus sp. AS-1-6 TaxID=2874599 RepID=UPI001CC170A9|nr:non-ribosomal peptide synthetase [Corallococcus sp. AS-1-6]MBZ4377269.1 amino acid adenylation domain-containing protein [Corallococcus sp. AS-1-6]
MATKLSDFALLDSEDADVISRSNETGMSLDLSRSVVDLFNLQAGKTPEAAACLGRQGRVTYAELNRRANQVAHHLLSLGVGPDVPVGVLFERSAEQLIAILGILKAGGCYVPLDPQYPSDYVQQVLTDARPRMVVADRRLGERMLWGVDQRIHLDDAQLLARGSHDPGVRVSPEQLAYVMYTSGSAGLPKGVMVPHRQILNWLHAVLARVPFGEDEVVAQKTSTSFAISVKELFAGLVVGVPQVFIDDATVRDVAGFIRELEQSRVTRLYTFPSQLAELLSSVHGAYERLRSLRHLYISIEPCPTELLAKVRAAMPWVTPWYIFGCTEINDVTYCDPADQTSNTGFVPIGRPIRNTRVFVLDEELRKVPVGAMGEMYVESLSLARGYWGLPELTAERFIANPHANDGSRLYKTGDLARYLPDGSLEFLGRRDYEVKIRGYRVDVRQVEKVLGSHPDLHEVAVVGWPLGGTQPQLVAYVVPRVKGAAPIQEIRDYLSASLPAYMVPTLFQVLEALPRLPNDKVDRLSLPEPKVEPQGEGYVPPRTATEKALAEIWSDVLSQGRAPVEVGVTHNFFELGGHSLLAAQMFSRIRQKFDLELPINTLFETPVLEGFASAVDAALAGRNGPTQGLISMTDRGEALPLSYVQERLWFIHEHMVEQRTSYNVAFACHMRGKGLSLPALRAAINGLVARHETFRTTFVVPEGGGYPVQRIADSLWIEVPLIEVEASGVAARMAAHAGHVFDLAKGPLLKVSVLRVTPEHHVFMLNMHHLICDGWSIDLLLRDLYEFYMAAETGSQPNLPPLPLQYADYAVWQRKQDLGGQLDYWKRTLEGYQEGLSLPYDYARPPNRAWRAASVRHAFPAELAARLSEVSKSHQATLFMTLMASTAILLNRYSGREDLCVGTTVAGRDHLELENLIGFFVNILAIRVDLRGNPTAETVLQRVRAQMLEGMKHRELPFEHILAALQKQRDSSQIPLVPVVMRHQNFPTVTSRDLGRDLGAGEIEFGDRTTPNELDLQFAGDGSSLEVVVEYAKDLFSERTVQRLITHLQQVLQTLVDKPDCRLTDFPLVTEDVHQGGASGAKGGRLDLSKSPIALFNERVKASPDAVACMGVEGSLTYRELDRRSNQVAHHLRARGVKRETRVGLLFERSPDLLVALLGILKAGGCFVPLDPGYPQEYLDTIVADARPHLVLSGRALGERLSRAAGQRLYLDDVLAASTDVSELPEATDPEQLMYVMYTSGSTGLPKGVLVPHRQILNWLYPLWKRVPFGEDEVVAQKTSTAFAVSMKELFSGLLAGVPLAFIDGAVVKDAEAFVSHLQRWRVTRLFTLPSHLESILSHVHGVAERLGSLRHVILAGEPCPVELVEKLRETLPSCTAWLNYGCTEVNDITYCAPNEQFHSSGFVPIGRPIQHTRAMVLDDELRSLPVGIMGELHVESPGTARGYWGQPELTAERFIPNPFGEPGSRLYRTGDMARVLEDGSLEFLGRRDYEVKIRGHRVDVRQVEKCMAGHPEVLESAALGWPRGAKTPQLLAYIVTKPGHTLSIEDMREYLSARLPTYMVPTLYLFLPALPRLPNGKLDRLGLPEPKSIEEGGDYVAPQTPTEKTLSGLWSECLKQGDMPAPQVGRLHNFFNLGGHSLLAHRVLSQVHRHFGVNLGIQSLFDSPVLKDFAATVDKALAPESPEGDGAGVVHEAGAEDSVIVPLATLGTLPNLFCVHPVGGQVTAYRELALAMGKHARVYALQSEGAREFSAIEPLARFYADAILKAQPDGGYRLLGWSSGGLIALAIARELEHRGCAVEYVGLVDSAPIPKLAGERGWAPLIAATHILGTTRGRGFSIPEVDAARTFLESRGWSEEVFVSEEGPEALEELARHFGISLSEGSSEYLLARLETAKYYLSLFAGFTPQTLGPKTDLYLYEAAERAALPSNDGASGWRAPRANVVQVPGNHYTVLQGENALRLAGRISEVLAAPGSAAAARTRAS